MLRYTGIREVATCALPESESDLFFSRTLRRSSPSMARSMVVSIRTVAT